MAMRACYVAELTRVPGASGARALDHKRTHAMHLHLHGSANLNLMGYRHARSCVRPSISIAWIQLLPVRSIELEPILFKNSSTLLCMPI